MARIKKYNFHDIDWNNQSYDEFCDILEDVYDISIKRTQVQNGLD